MRIIEITRGEKPKEQCFKFGVTTEHDYYVALSGIDIHNVSEWDLSGKMEMFIQKVRGIRSRKSFSYSKEFLKFNDKYLFPKT